MQIGVPTEKSQNFVPSAKRVLALLRPERAIVWVVLGLAVGSVVLCVAVILLAHRIA